VSAIEVVDPGVLTTVQDLGRAGWAHAGVPPSGALDPRALDRGNRLVGNGTGTAALEATLIGPRLLFHRPALVAVTGVVDSRPRQVAAGEELNVGLLAAGARAYICVRGGIDVEPVLGSRSTDLLSGLGPPPLRAGMFIPIGPEPVTSPQSVPAATQVEVALRIRPGPRADWFTPDAIDLLVGSNWRVSPSSNRIGIRLEGPTLGRARSGELRSEGVVTGALQVPPSGQPILLMNDHPTTGGYPVLAVVLTDDLPVAGQLRPGDHLRFRR
jgi:biotin-dependent carboxylase-like uncharacterized protein